MLELRILIIDSEGVREGVEKLLLKGHCHEHNFKNSTAPKTCLHHWKSINSGQVFLKLLYQCTEAKYRVISL